MATSSSKKKTGTAKKSAPAAKKPASAPKKQPAAKAAPAPVPTAPTWPYALVCIILSLLAFLSLFHAEGVIIDGFAGFLCGIMGWGFWAFPFAMLLLAWIFVRNPREHFGLRVTAALLIAPLFGTIVHLMVCRVAFTAQTFGAIVGQLYDGGKALTSGGVISGGVGYLLKAGISVYAALPLTMAAFVLCVLGSMDLSVGKIAAWSRARREAQYIPDEDVPLLDDDEDEPVPQPLPDPQRSPRRTAPDKPPEKKKRIDIPFDETKAEPDDDPIDPIPVKKPARGAKKAAPAEATQNVQPLSVEEAANICGVTVPATQEIQDPPKPSKKAASAAVAAETAAITSAIESENADHSAYQLPPVSFLRAGKKDQTDATEEIRFNRDRLNTALSSFGVNATIRDVTRGPTVTRYDLELEAGVKLNKITNLSGDLALALGVENVRIAPIPDKISTVGIEVPNKIVSAVCLRDIIDSPAFRNAKSKLSFAVGKDIGGNCIIGNIAKLPHMLIAGTTGSGKSVCMNSLILSLLYKATPDEVRLIMIDPKMVELGIYNGIPHLFIPVVTDPKKAAGALQWAVVEMLKRYRLFSEAQVRDLASYNALQKNEPDGQTLPQVVIVIDELADLMLCAAKEVEESICRVAQMGRAAGMHLIIATQRPSADVITGLMKANIPSRIAFAVSSSLESRIILDTSGAEKLIGMGDMLYAPIGTGKPLRVQGSYVSDEEREEVVRFIKQNSEAQYSDDIIAQIEKSAAEADKKSGPAPEADKPAKSDYDELLPQAVDVILETKQASVSMLQRRLKLGYSRAARMVDQMEEMGIVGPFEGSKPRKILITKQQWQEMQYVQGTAPSEVLQAQTDFADVNEEEPEDDES
ncbi:MAG: DNA translocase FtsK [Oscillospiraceae bacterium]|nr:DNA translocase FtsK [Oscillospiraceae bacterium]